MVKLASDAVRAENPALTQRAGRHLADRPRFMRRLRDTACSTPGRGGGARLSARLEPLADRRMAGAHRRDRGGDAPAGVGHRGRRLDLRRRGSAGVRPAAHGRAADRPRAAHPLVLPVRPAARPGRRPRATARPRARATTATSTWACCARTARRSWPAPLFADYTPRARHLPVVPLRGPPARRRRAAGSKRLGVRKLRTGL